MQFDLSILFFIKRVKVDKEGMAPIYCRITVNGERAELSVNEKTVPGKWDSAAQRIKGRSELVRVINDHIEIIESKIKSHFNKCIDNNEPVSAGILKDLLSGKHQRKYFLIQIFIVPCKSVRWGLNKAYQQINETPRSNPAGSQSCPARFSQPKP